MGLGLGASLNKTGLTTPGIVTDSLVMKHNYSAGSVVPISDGAAYFTSSAYIRISDNATFNHDNGSASLISVGCWIKIAQSDENDAYISKYDYHASQTAREWRLSVNADQKPIAVISSNGSNTFTFTGGTALDSNWNHFIFTYDGSEGTAADRPLIYINGVEQTLTQTDGSATDGSTNPAQIHEDDADVIMGAMLNNNAPSGLANSYVCNAGVWHSVLTPAQIKSIMNKNYAGLTTTEKTNLVSWWNLDDTIGASDGINTNDSLFTLDNNYTLGAEKMSNFGFEDSSQTSYSTTNASYSYVSGGSGLEGTADPAANQTVVIPMADDTITTGKYYLVSFDIISTNGNTGGITAGHGSGDPTKIDIDKGAARSHYWYPARVGTHSSVLTATESGTITMSLHVGTQVGDVTTFDNLSVKEILGNVGKLT